MIAKMITVSLAACILLPAVLSQFNRPIEAASDIDSNYLKPLRYINNIDDIRYVKNINDAYKNYNQRLAANVEGSNDQENKYQMWKRNADIINTLLGIPRRMLEIGR